jgi:hypothetical protein
MTSPPWVHSRQPQRTISSRQGPGYQWIQRYQGNQLTSPPLTTIRQPTYEIGRQLTDMLLKTLNGQELPTQQVTIRPQLVLRASTG